MKSKYGNVRGTTYGSSRTNIPSSASKNRGIGNAAETVKPHKAPVQVCSETVLIYKFFWKPEFFVLEVYFKASIW